MSEYKPPRRTPSQVSHLERLLDSYGRATGIAPNRVRRWMTMMVMIGALDRVQADPDQALFLVKGGVAMELRLRQGARATKDLDMVFLGDPRELLIALDDALTEPYSLFSFERGPAEEIGDTGSQRLEVKVQFNGRSWATVRLEVSQPEGRAGAESQLLDAISIEDFGLIGPEKVSCLSMRYQIAQKLHACTETFPTGPDNDRFRDLIDLLLLRALDIELPPIREACFDVFRARRKHAWPPALAVPASWAEPYARLAGELEFSIEDVDEAAASVRAFISEIDDAVVLAPHRPRIGQTWRRSDGVRVYIEQLSSTTAVVNETNPESQTTAANAIHPDDLQHMVLVDDPELPTWHVTVTGSFGGATYNGLAQIGEISGAASLRPLQRGVAGPVIEAQVVDPDETTVRARIESVVPRGAQILNIRRM